MAGSNAIMQAIKSGEFATIYLLYGEESYLKRYYKNQMVEHFGGLSGMNVNHFEGRGIDEKELASILQTAPFFEEKRFVLVENSGFFKKAPSDALLKVLENLPDFVVLLFVEEETDGKTKLFKAVKKTGELVVCDYLKEVDLVTWIAKYLSHQGKKISRASATSLIQRVGVDLETLSRELDKLVSYVGSAKTVTTEDVLDVSIKRSEYRIFDLIDAVGSGKKREAFQIYYDLVESGMKAPMILYMLARQCNQMLLASLMKNGGKGIPEITRHLGLHGDWLAKKLVSQASHYDSKHLKKLFEECVSYEEAVKSGRLGDQVACEMILVDLLNTDR